MYKNSSNPISLLIISGTKFINVFIPTPFIPLISSEESPQIILISFIFSTGTICFSNLILSPNLTIF